MSDYCAHCGHYGELTDGVYCHWCLDFYYANNRLPNAGDSTPTTLERLYARLDVI